MQDEIQLSSGGRNSQRYLVGLSVFSIALNHQIISGDSVSIYGFSISTNGIEQLTFVLLIAAFIWCNAQTMRYYSRLSSAMADKQIKRQKNHFSQQFDLRDPSYPGQTLEDDNEGVEELLLYMKRSFDRIELIIENLFVYVAPAFPLMIGILALFSPNHLTRTFITP